MSPRGVAKASRTASVLHAVATTIRRVRLAWAGRSEETRWHDALALDTAQLQSNAVAYDHISARRSRELRSPRVRADPARAAAATWAMAVIEWQAGQFEQAHHLVESGLGLLVHAPAGVARWAAELVAAMSQAALREGRKHEALELLRRTHERSRACGDDHGSLLIAGRLALSYLDFGELDDAVATCNDALARVEAVDAPVGSPYRLPPPVIDPSIAGAAPAEIRETLLSLFTIRAHARAVRGDFESADTGLLEAIGRLGSPSARERRALAATRGLVALCAGRHPEALQLLRWATETTGEPDEIARESYYLLGLAYLDIERVKDASDVGIRLSMIWSTSAAGWYVRALAELGLDRAATARAYAQQALAVADGDSVKAGALCILAEIALHEGDLARSLALATESVETILATGGLSPLFSSAMQATLARAEAACGSAADAEARFRAALALPLPPRHPRRLPLLRGYADLLSGTGREAEAEDMRIGARAVEAEIVRLAEASVMNETLTGTGV